MAKQATVLAFYQSRNAADAALKELRRNGIGRAAAAHHARDGGWISDPGGLGDLLARYRPWVVRNESLVLLRAPAPDAERGLGLLRQTPGGPPLSFVFVGEELPGVPADEAGAPPPPRPPRRAPPLWALSDPGRCLAASRTASARLGRCATSSTRR
jgi:hypothetical protein